MDATWRPGNRNQNLRISREFFWQNYELRGIEMTLIANVSGKSFFCPAKLIVHSSQDVFLLWLERCWLRQMASSRARLLFLGFWFILFLWRNVDSPLANRCRAAGRIAHSKSYTSCSGWNHPSTTPCAWNRKTLWVKMKESIESNNSMNDSFHWFSKVFRI